MNRQYQSTTGLDTNSLPFRLYQKAKMFGQWDPLAIDFSKDKEDWKRFSADERHFILLVLSQFQAGEEAVTVDLLPLVMAIAEQGHLEEEMYLTTFLFEEAKHVEFFRLFFDSVGHTEELAPNTSENYNRIFSIELPTAMKRLRTDTSPEAIANASVTYNMFVEGVLAETGYYGFQQSCARNNILPGLLAGLEHTKRDESRHIGYGTFLLQRLISQDGDLFDFVSQRMSELMPLAMGLIEDNYAHYETPPFGVDADEFINYALKQLGVRLEVLERARGKTMSELYRMKESEVGIA
ncbi:R2-like ligand-binding oxidase [Effusibacillus consociatus]|uniref:R2-like ligand binding oxidase n=1 Tax=Effusibacillus consociatus TaxID=1117041 RepID=A0ABV9PZE3_9BACL